MKLRALQVVVAAGMIVGAGGGSRGAMARDDGHAFCLEHRLEALDAKRTRELHFDEASGRDVRKYPPHVLFDYEHMFLSLQIRDMNVPELTATCGYQMRALLTAVREVRLRVGPPESMKIKSVNFGWPDEGGHKRAVAAIGAGLVEAIGLVAEFEHKGEELSIRFPESFNGEAFHIVIKYDLVMPPEGLTWVPESAAFPGRPAQLHTQGQPESNHYWFPCHDFPNERASQTIEVSVPQGYVASANGALTDHVVNGGRETFTWTLEKPHVPYLASLVVGKFDIVKLASPKSGLPLEVYAPLGKGELVQQTYGRTGAMIDFFEKFTGTAYPWPRYAQLVVHNFSAGGMENTSATTMFDTAILDKTALLDGDLDGLISHELAHQWFGDLATCHSWEHIWLNEGFATYLTHVWFQHRDGEDAYLAGLYGTRAGLIENDKSDPAPAPYVPAMCSKEYRHPWDVFRRGANPYPKGAFILHMLREQLGDGPFRAGVKLHLERAAFKTVETDQFRQAMEEASGESLERFFQQWCYRPGVPRVAVTPMWNAASGELVVKAVQTQPMDGYNPAFALRIPVVIRMRGGEWIERTLAIDTREAEMRVKLNEAPGIVEVDPRVTVLADLQVAQPAVRWIAQLRDGSTIAARMQAIDSIGRSGQPAPAGMLANFVRPEGEHHAIRSAAATRIRKLGGGDVLAELAERRIDDARVRNTVMVELAAAAKEEPEVRARALKILRAALQQDKSYAVRASAAKALGELGDVDSLSLLVAATNSESQHDQIRQAAVEGLAALDRVEAIEAVMKVAEPGHMARTRPVALKALGKLAKHDADRVYATLDRYLDDAEGRTRRGAIEGLVAAASERSRKPIERLGAMSGSEAERAMSEQALRDLDAAIAEGKVEKKQKPARKAWVSPKAPASK